MLSTLSRCHKGCNLISSVLIYCAHTQPYVLYPNKLDFLRFPCPINCAEILSVPPPGPKDPSGHYSSLFSLKTFPKPHLRLIFDLSLVCLFPPILFPWLGTFDHFGGRGQREQHELQNLIMMVSKATHGCVQHATAQHLIVAVNLQQQPAYSQALTDIL